MFLPKDNIQETFKTDQEMEVVIDYLKSIENCDMCSVDDVIYIKFSPQRTNVKVDQKVSRSQRLKRRKTQKK